MAKESEYFARARGWATDLRAQERKLARIAWTVAAALAAVAVMEAVALSLMVPLKQVQTVTLLVDRQTGYVQAIDPRSPTALTASESLTQSFLAQYVTAREEFDRVTVSRDYQRVGLWSDGGAKAQYLASMQTTNPDSPARRYAGGYVATIRVKSVSKLSVDTAMVRFDQEIWDKSGRKLSIQAWLSVIRYRYSHASMRIDDRLINPLGFQVVTYRKDAEALPDVGSGVATSYPAAGRNMGSSNNIDATSYSPLRRIQTFRGLSPGNIPQGSPILSGAVSSGDAGR